MSDREEDKSSEKTEEPSHRKLEQARKDGKIFMSKEMASFMIFFSFTILLLTIFPWAARNTFMILKEHISSCDNVLAIHGNNNNSILKITIILLKNIILILLIPLSILAATVILSSLLQHGPIFSTKQLKFDLNRISIIKGFQRIVSLNSIFELIKGLIKILLVGYSIYIVLNPYLASISNTNSLEVIGIMHFIYDMILKMFYAVCIIMFFIGIGDYIFQRNKFMSEMRMSKQEIKDEHKHHEGSIEIKMRIRALRAEHARRLIIKTVPQATVVITNPNHYAVALQYYIKSMPAPKLIAKGVDEIALEMKKIAKKHNIPIVEDKSLARAIYSSTKVQEYIKLEHYKEVAKIISYIIKLDQKESKNT